MRQISDQRAVSSYGYKQHPQPHTRMRHGEGCGDFFSTSIHRCSSGPSRHQPRAIAPPTAAEDFRGVCRDSIARNKAPILSGDELVLPWETE